MRSKHDPVITSRPEVWHRALCFVHERLIVTGGLPESPALAAELLAQWAEIGVTHVVDVRGEYNDEALVAQLTPQIKYVWAPTHDAGGRQAGAWFDAVLDDLGDAAHDEDALILVHCHMGVNRGPSMALRLLLHQGYDAVDALRAARPIAAIAYAEDAVNHWNLTLGSPETLRYAERRRVHVWHRDDPIDTGWIISRTRITN